ncbi:MAG: undecaprenyl-diphosphate phosphatase [Ruminococcaceae bacterium]|nr:undecaprenyl-diphosphate phosphatase [Oscillospiraceae bacterium]
MKFFEILKAIFIGIVEGITEWLPISSTGHMILVDEFIKLNLSDEFKELFFVVIQLGAIAAVPVLFWNKLNPFSKKKSEQERRMTWTLWFKVIVGVIPAAVLGFLLDDFFDKHFYNYVVVSVALVVYGILFLVVEKCNKGKEYRINDVHSLSYKDALIIGSFQMLALIPGTSRSGSTILGGMLTGVSRVASAEFSFFMAIPVMLGASLLKVAKFVIDGFTVSGFELLLLGVAMVVSFVVSVASIKFLMDFVKRHSFSPFGVYRIILGAIVLGYFLIGKIV